MPSAPAQQSLYQEALTSLSSLIPELLGMPGQPRRKFSLTEINLLCAALGNPQQRFPSILVAGTNGKGSTAATLASIAHASGLRVGLYTSPHLARINERIRLNNDDIPDEAFATLYFRVYDAARHLVLTRQLPILPSFFELLTALAFLYFAESHVDLAILEVGMGGRLDATNIVSPLLSVITDISLDHQEWLGSTIDLIAREKAGILRPHGTLVTLPQHPEANQALGEVAMQLEVRGINAADYMPPAFGAPDPDSDPNRPYSIEVMGTQILVDSPLKGAHQHRNIALAIAAAVDLAQTHHLPITPASIQQGIQTTRWPGRLERLTLPHHPEFILDVAHNPAGAWALRAALSATPPPAGAPGLEPETWDQKPAQPKVLIFACLRDKPLREMTQILFPIFNHVILAPIQSPRANDLADLVSAAESIGVPSTPAASVAEAIQFALALHPATIVISGSLFLVAEARTLLLNRHLESPQEPRP